MKLKHILLLAVSFMLLPMPAAHAYSAEFIESFSGTDVSERLLILESSSASADGNVLVFDVLLFPTFGLTGDLEFRVYVPGVPGTGRVSASAGGGSISVTDVTDSLSDADLSAYIRDGTLFFSIILADGMSWEGIASVTVEISSGYNAGLTVML